METARNSENQPAENRMQNPESIHVLFEQLVNEAAIDQLASLYEPSAVLIERDGTLFSGRNAIREHLAALLALRPRMTIRNRTVIRAGEVAILVSEWELEAEDPDGKPIRDGGRTYDVVRRQADGTWRLAVDNPWDVAPQ